MEPILIRLLSFLVNRSALSLFVCFEGFERRRVKEEAQKEIERDAQVLSSIVQGDGPNEKGGLES